MSDTVWSWASLTPLMPEIFMALSAMLLLVIGASRKDGPATLINVLAVLAFAVTIGLIVRADWTPVSVLSDHFLMDGFAAYLKIIILVGLGASLLVSLHYLKKEKIALFEYPVLVMLAGTGMMVMVSANSFLALYVGLELQSLALYVLAAIRRDHARSSEAGLKYFVLGALASGMLLFGISLIYGYVGAIGFDAVGDTLEAARLEGTLMPGAVIGMVFIIVAIAFKVSAVPFHMWTPDVYEGAPTAVTALFAIVPKVAAVGLLLRVLYDPFAAMMVDWQQIIWVLAAASMALGGIAGIVQKNIKRLMAYSAIGNIGFALVGVVAGTTAGIGAALLYVTIYMVMSAGVFGVILFMRRNNVAVEKISDLSGLSKTHPVMAYAMAALMFSMAGIPPLAGFFSKVVVFQAAIAAEFYVLAVFGLVTSVLAAYYYLYIVKIMFFDDVVEKLDREPSLLRNLVVAASTVFILGFIMVPDILMATSNQAASVLLPAND